MTTGAFDATLARVRRAVLTSWRERAVRFIPDAWLAGGDRECLCKDPEQFRLAVLDVLCPVPDSFARYPDEDPIAVDRGLAGLSVEELRREWLRTRVRLASEDSPSKWLIERFVAINDAVEAAESGRRGGGAR